MTDAVDSPACGIILGIDPGTVTMGFCAMRVDLRTLERLSIETFTINTDKPTDGVNTTLRIPEHHSALFMRLREHSKRLKAVFETFSPFQVAAELPFFNRLHPTAFGPLAQLLITIENALYDYNPWQTLYRVENTVTKALVAPATKEERQRIKALKDSKARVAESVRIHPDFQFVDTIALDEHQIDAVLVAEWRRRQLLSGVVEQT